MSKEFCNFCGSNDMDKEDLKDHIFGSKLTGQSLGKICSYCFDNYIYQRKGKREMKIRELISTLLKTDNLDTEIIVTYWNKDYFLEATNLTVEQVDTVWEDFVKEAQETIESHLEFTNTGYDLASDLEELIEGKDNA